MSDRATVDREAVDFLATVPLLEGLDEAALEQLARVMRRRTVQEGRVLWRQGEHGREVFVVVEGTISTSLGLPGDRTLEFGKVGPGEILGEIALLDGHGHTLGAQVTESATLLALGQLDFAALLVTQNPAAFALRRRLASHLTARLRGQIHTLAVALGGESDGVQAAGTAPDPADLEQCKAPDSKYVRRMATFRDLDPLALWGFLTSGRYVRCPPGRTLVAEGTPSNDYYLMINGAVEKVLVRRDRRIRVGLAGPGIAFGYESLIDGLPSPVTAITRERVLLLVVPGNVFEHLFYREDAVSRVFLEAIQRDLLVALRQALRQWARLRASA
jgi:CRP-like cAMP-binding protein